MHSLCESYIDFSSEMALEKYLMNILTFFFGYAHFFCWWYHNFSSDLEFSKTSYEYFVIVILARTFDFSCEFVLGKNGMNILT